MVGGTYAMAGPCFWKQLKSHLVVIVLNVHLPVSWARWSPICSFLSTSPPCFTFSWAQTFEHRVLSEI